MKIVLSIFVLIAITTGSMAQGCSDAGACSVGDLRLSGRLSDDEQPDLSIQYRQSIGLADKYSVVSFTSVRVSHMILQTTRLEAMLPFQATFGNLATTSGVGDLLVSLSQAVFRRDNSRISLVAGGRFRSNDSDKSSGGIPLPMVYQTSLGTNDIIAGLNYILRGWRFGFAYQHPFGANNNGYLLVPGTPGNKSYFESAYLKRGDDIMLRVEKAEYGKGKNSYSYGLLSFYRLQKDQIKRNDVYEQLNESDGLTLNIFFAWFRNFGRNKTFSLTGGFPALARHNRPDGLTRTLIVNGGVSFRFQNKDRRMESDSKLYDPKLWNTEKP
ncbi:MAG: hypothetical protein JXA03_15055 [Bacteroidales bacterium]|nr:hypothetical protein [Bacteroidales bacterium]